MNGSCQDNMTCLLISLSRTLDLQLGHQCPHCNDSKDIWSPVHLGHNKNILYTTPSGEVPRWGHWDWWPGHSLSKWCCHPVWLGFCLKLVCVIRGCYCVIIMTYLQPLYTHDLVSVMSNHPPLNTNLLCISCHDQIKALGVVSDSYCSFDLAARSSLWEVKHKVCRK